MNHPHYITSAENIFIQTLQNGEKQTSKLQSSLQVTFSEVLLMLVDDSSYHL